MEGARDGKSVASLMAEAVHVVSHHDVMEGIAAAPVGDPNASIPTPQPVCYRPMFASFGKLRTTSSVTFVAQAALASNL